jgi:lipid II:glycine glycyltransferase (peptidoglycan interpeptide bridge formation enzyme)
MNVEHALDQAEWDAFIGRQQFRPFLQNWTMGEVFRDAGGAPVRLLIKEGGEIVAICQGIITRARRGPHIAIAYGPIMSDWRSATGDQQVLKMFIDVLKDIARNNQCTFIRMSPFWPKSHYPSRQSLVASYQSPLHMFAEHVWYLPLVSPDAWQGPKSEVRSPRSEEELLMQMRKTTRNLVRRAEREGVTVTASKNPQEDIEIFLRLHEQTRKRHGFTPYSNAFFRSQVKHFAPRGECTLYIARWKDEVLASSIHMHVFGETSYHHGASSGTHPEIPASYLLQWTAIRDALKRGDHVYSFWGVAPEGVRGHPFSGVTTFKTGFGGNLLELMHCIDIPLSPAYHLTRAFELLRKWRRGF